MSGQGAGLARLLLTLISAVSMALAGNAAPAQELVPPIEPLWTIPLPAAIDRDYHGREVVNAAFLPGGGYVLLAEESVDDWAASTYSVMISDEAGTLGTWIPLELETTPLLIALTLTELAVGPGGEIYLAGASLQGLALLPLPGLANSAVMVIKLTPDGAVEWERSYFQDVVEGFPEDLVALPSGVAITGNRSSSSETYVASISAEGNWQWSRSTGIAFGESSVSAFPDGRILLLTRNDEPRLPSPSTSPIVAATFHPDGTPARTTIVHQSQPAPLASDAAFVTGLALADEAYVVFERPGAAGRYPLSAVRLDDSGTAIWRVDQLTGADPNESCWPVLASDERSLLVSCGDNPRLLMLIDRGTGAHRTFVVPKPACQTSIQTELFAATTGPDAVFLLALAELPPMGRAPSCVWMARVSLD